MRSIEDWNRQWLQKISNWAAEQMEKADSGHGIDHVRRVVENVQRIGHIEGAATAIVLPAAWLHDCVYVPKNSPERRQASVLAARSAEKFLESIEYPASLVPPIVHCIEAHSFSANVACQSIEARVVQDSDRLEALGAIGLARCLMTGGSMGQRLYHPSSPFPANRPANDNEQSVDHFFAKLLGLHRSMQTESGRHEAKRRTEFLVVFLRQLASEIGASTIELEEALELVTL